MLPAVDCQIDLRIAEIFRFVVRQQKHSTVAGSLASMAAVTPPVIRLDAVFVKLYARHDLALLHFAGADGLWES